MFGDSHLDIFSNLASWQEQGGLRDSFDDHLGMGVKLRRTGVRRGGENGRFARIEASPQLVKIHLYPTSLRQIIICD